MRPDFQKSPKNNSFLCRLLFTMEFLLSIYYVPGTVFSLAEDTAVKKAISTLVVCFFYSSGQIFESISSWTKIFLFLLFM